MMRFIDIAELAAALQVSKLTIRRWAAAGHIPPPVRVARTVRWRHEDLERWHAAGCPHQSENQEPSEEVSTHACHQS